MSDPALIRDQIIEAAARALFASEMPGSDWEVFPGLHDKFRACARAVLAAATPLIRAQVLEEVAVVADKDDWSTWEEVVAAVTRALKEQLW